MDRLDEMIVLTTILDADSMSDAARRLRRSPAGVTRSLAALEQRVGTRLIHRSTRQLKPTEAGRLLAARARQLIVDYERAVGGVTERDDAPLQGLLRITAPTLFGRWHIAPLLTRFLDAHRGVRAELVLSNRNLDLVEQGLDMAVRIGRTVEPGMTARRVGRVHVVLSASPAYIAGRGRPRTPKDLSKHDIVLVSEPRSVSAWRFRAAGREKIVRLTPRLMTTDVETALSAARAAGGIVRTLSYQVADDLSSRTLVRLLRDFEPPPLPVHLVVPAAPHVPRLVRAFLDHAAQALEPLRVIRQ
jgi:DNA-binding transcriptional LysR family regulator